MKIMTVVMEMIVEDGYDSDGYEDKGEQWWWWWQIIIPACVNGPRNLRTQVYLSTVWNDNMADLMWSTMTLWSHVFMAFLCTHGTFPQEHWKFERFVMSPPRSSLQNCQQHLIRYSVACWLSRPGLEAETRWDLGTWKPTIKRLLCSSSKEVWPLVHGDQLAPRFLLQGVAIAKPGSF